MQQAREVSSVEELKRSISSGVSVVLFYRPTCPACKRFLPIFDTAISRLSKGLVFYKVNNEAVKEASRIFSIAVVPTVVVFKDGAEIKRSEGAVGEEELLDFLRSLSPEG